METISAAAKAAAAADHGITEQAERAEMAERVAEVEAEAVEELLREEPGVLVVGAKCEYLVSVDQINK